MAQVKQSGFEKYEIIGEKPSMSLPSVPSRKSGGVVHDHMVSILSEDISKSQRHPASGEQGQVVIIAIDTKERVVFTQVQLCAQHFHIENELQLGEATRRSV
ncbi:hypothetical protein [Janthinobacterium sp.]|uniref:hypothetical protein n=1 Tax=Janthinobacterium sp. TaxID=1871054 RepID=UPI0025C5E756|nr:hypothetical protein [Janthinobacterium sp.]